MAKIILLLFVFLIGLGALFVGYVGKQLLSPSVYAYTTLIAKINLDRARCMMERLGLVEVRRAHFSPVEGHTIDRFRCRVEGAKFVTSPLSAEILVVSDFGGSIERIGKDGSVVWRKSLLNPRGVGVDAGRVFVADLNRIHVLELASGVNLGFFKLPFLVSKAVGVDGKVAVLSNEIRSSLYIYSVIGDRLELDWKIENVGVNARDFVFDLNRVYVADTFGHKVKQYSVATGRKVSEIESFYPNSIQLLSRGKLLVSEEHLNALSEFDFNNFTRVVVHTCESGIGARSLQEHRSVASRPAKNGMQSSCKVSPWDYQNSNLFSPNDAKKKGGLVFVADTDNNRVIVLGDDGSVLSSVYNFNNPVGVWVLDN